MELYENETVDVIFGSPSSRGKKCFYFKTIGYTNRSLRFVKIRLCQHIQDTNFVLSMCIKFEFCKKQMFIIDAGY